MIDFGGGMCTVCRWICACEEGCTQKPRGMGVSELELQEVSLGLCKGSAHSQAEFSSLLTLGNRALKPDYIYICL